MPSRPATLESLDIRPTNKSVSRDFNAFYAAFGNQFPDRLSGNTTQLRRFALGYPFQGVDFAH